MTPQEYIDRGWQLCVIPQGQKGPNYSGWNDKGVDSVLDGYNCGLLHSLSGTCAIDIDDLAAASAWLAEQNIDLNSLLGAPDAVQIVSGREGSAKLLYSLPTFMAMPSRKITKDGKTILEFRCASQDGASMQDVLPPSIHPNGTVYSWAGAGDWHSLPDLPGELLVAWKSLDKPLEQQSGNSQQSGEHNPIEVMAALYKIDPNCDRQTWIECGMALHSEGMAFELWNNWSMKSESKYPGEREMRKQWASFKEKPNGITANTLFHHAIKAGWEKPIPPDMFKPVKNDLSDVMEKVSPTIPPPEVDLELWPKALADRAREVAVEVGCDPVAPLMAGLCAVSGAVDKRIRLSINPSWKVPPTFWCMLIGRPSDKKSPGSKPMFAPLRKLELEDRDRYRAAMLAWEGKEARYAAQKKAYREFEASPDADLPNSQAPHVDPLPDEPQAKRLLINDATSQKVVSMAAGRPGGFLMHLDEMHKWLSKLNDPRNTDDRGCWIQGYETGHYTMDRQGTGTTQVENLALSLFGAVQPGVFRTYVGAASQDGIAQRFMPIALNPNHNKMWQMAVPSFLSHEYDWEQLVRRVHGLPTFEYVFHPDGLSEFRKFGEWAIHLRESEQLIQHSESYLTALGKMEGNCARLILLFHLMENPYCPFIEQSTVDRACQIFRTYFVPSLRHAFLQIAEQSDPLSRKILDSVIQLSGVKATVTLSDLRRMGRSTGGQYTRPIWEVEQLARAAMDDLAEAGFVTLQNETPRSAVWAINPSLGLAFQKHREKIIKAKQAALDLIRDCAVKKYGVEPKRMSIPTGTETIQPEVFAGSSEPTESD